MNVADLKRMLGTHPDEMVAIFNAAREIYTESLLQQMQAGKMSADEERDYFLRRQAAQDPALKIKIAFQALGTSSEE